MKFTIGSDIEFFVYDREGGLAPSQGLIGDDEKGTKHNPITDGGFTFQRDNVAVEFATPVCHSRKEYVQAIRKGILKLHAMIPEGYSLKAIPSAVFEKEQLEHPEAMEFGCDPDFNAWKKGRVNPKPYSDNVCLRTAGFHIHVGHKDLNTKEMKEKFIRNMDRLLGVFSILVDRSPESAMRKELYGKAGAFRPTPYGCEYRTLSSFWASHPKYVEIAYNLTKVALISTIYEDEYTDQTQKNFESKIENIINTNNLLKSISFSEYFSLFPWVNRASSIKTTTLLNDWR